MLEQVKNQADFSYPYALYLVMNLVKYLCCCIVPCLPKKEQEGERDDHWVLRSDFFIFGVETYV